MKSLAGKTVLVTGAGGGFGREFVRQLLLAGSHLILTDRDAHALHTAVEEIVAALRTPPPGRVLSILAADLAERDGVEELFARSQAITPELDVLVNNAGIAVYGRISDIPADKWERVLAVNLLAPMRLTALVLPGMIARRSGHIANVASVAGLIGAPMLSAYSAAKFGLRGFAEAIAAEVAPFGVDLTTIYPFYARTPILQVEKFGVDATPMLPDRLLYEPAFVVAQMIDGIQKRKRHVYPGAIPRQFDVLRRVAPMAIDALNRRLV